jgi:hypothetical protein
MIPCDPPPYLEATGPTGPFYEEIEALYSYNLPKFDSVVHREKRAAWEALGIRSYRFTATRYYGLDLTYVPPYRIPLYFTITVYPDKEPKIVCNREGWSFGPDDDPFGYAVQGKTFDKFIFITIGGKGPYIQGIEYDAAYHYPKYFRARFPPPDDPSIFYYPGELSYYFYVHSFEVLEE